MILKPVVALKHGNLFGGPADLIVLPCSTAGTITGFVARTLAHHKICHPRAGLQLGEVDIMPFEGGDDIAQYVGFAASVRGLSSSEKAIYSIAEELGCFTNRVSSVKRISAPLLGTGAGGLDAENVVEALREGFISRAGQGTTLVIHVLDDGVYQRIKARRRSSHAEQRKPLRVFISHTSKTAAACDWVEALALYLIEQGVQARLDRFHLRRGMDLAQWMSNELSMAQKVIVVCDEMYKQRADGRLGGVGWETMLIQGDMARISPDSTKYQVVVRANQLDDGLPFYLQTRYAFHAPQQDERFRAELLHELLDLPIAPQINLKEVVI
jgi:hypothetical protein